MMSRATSILFFSPKPSALAVWKQPRALRKNSGWLHIKWTSFDENFFLFPFLGLKKVFKWSQFLPKKTFPRSQTWSKSSTRTTRFILMLRPMLMISKFRIVRRKKAANMNLLSIPHKKERGIFRMARTSLVQSTIRKTKTHGSQNCSPPISTMKLKKEK